MTSLDVMDELDAQVQHDVEVSSPANWRPLEPEEPLRHNEVALVDGVRRAEAYLRLEDRRRSFPALLGTLAVGGLALRLGHPNSMSRALKQSRVQRLLMVLHPAEQPGAGLQAVPASLPLPGDYLRVEVQGDKPNVLNLELQNRMRREESLIAAALHSEGHPLVVADGPLQNVLALAGSGVVGYIKSHRRLLLPETLVPVLADLEAGQRTPILRLSAPQGSQAYDRFTWYLRLAQALRGETALAGIVRLEVLADGGLERARHLASQLAHLLPRLVGGRHRDPRSPQNLTPIAALEQELRRRMGSMELVKRRLRQTLEELGDTP